MCVGGVDLGKETGNLGNIVSRYYCSLSLLIHRMFKGLTYSCRTSA